MRDMQLEAEKIPLIAAGGINSHAKMRQVLALGYAAVQLGTAFAVTTEGDAHPNFKKVLVEAQPRDIVEFVSVAGLPARAVRSIWLDRYLRRESVLQQEAAEWTARSCRPIPSASAVEHCSA